MKLNELSDNPGATKKRMRNSGVRRRSPRCYQNLARVGLSVFLRKTVQPVHEIEGGFAGIADDFHDTPKGLLRRSETKLARQQVTAGPGFPQVERMGRCRAFQWLPTPSGCRWK